MTGCPGCGRQDMALNAPLHQSVNGRVTIQVIRMATLEVLDEMIVGNKIPASGRAYLGKMVKGGLQSPTHIAVGTGPTAPTDGDVKLENEKFKDLITNRIDIADGVRIRFFLPTTAANGQVLREAGILSPLPDLLLLARVVYNAITKDQSVAVTYSWDLTFSQP